MVAILNQEKRVQSVLSAIKKNKKVFGVVEEIMVLAKILNIEVSGSSRGLAIGEVGSEQQKTEVRYELMFLINRNGRNFKDKVTFVYGENKLVYVEVLNYYPPFYKETCDLKVAVELLHEFKKNLIGGEV